MDQATSSSSDNCSNCIHNNNNNNNNNAKTSQEMQISERSDKCPLESFLKSKKLKMYNKSAKRIPALSMEDIKIGSRLGKGSFTKVHAISSISKSARKAMERSCCTSSTTSNDNSFVIKRLRVSVDEKALKRASSSLIGEATLLAQLDHPQIAKLRAFVSTPNRFCLIVDRWDCTLREKLHQWKDVDKNDVTFVSERLCYALELAEALEYLHLHRLIYRNLEPRNIGFTSQGTVVQLFDFGLCRKLPPKETANADHCYQMTYAGTARYLAPEVHRRTGYNRKADVYSWAVVTYEMMALTEPYQGMSREDYSIEVCEEGFRPCMDDLCYCPPLENLLHQTWCDDIDTRLTMKKVCAALEDIVASIDPETCDLVLEADEEEEEDYYDYHDSKHNDSHSTFSTLSDYSWLTDEDDEDEDDMDLDEDEW